MGMLKEGLLALLKAKKKKDTGAPSYADVVFVANRTDGLGQRLKAMVNAIALSEYFGAKFRFTWVERTGKMKDFHSVEPLRATFSDRFISAYLCDRPISPVPFSEFMSKHMKGEPVDGLCVSVPHDFQPIAQKWADHHIGAGGFASAFKDIEFSKDISAAITAAQAVDLSPELVALHLRAGDIVYGVFRFMDKFLDKITPFPVACALIARLRQQNKDVLIFGQDDVLCRGLAREYGAHFVGDLVPEQVSTPSQRSLFEVMLLSRCETIYLGNSGFAQLPLLVSGRTRSRSAVGSFDLDERLKLLDDGWEMPAGLRPAVSEKQKAIAAYCRAYAMSRLPEVSFDEVRADLQRAQNHDAENCFYRFVEAGWLYKYGKDQAAEELIASMLHGSGDGSLFFVLANQNRPSHPYRSWLQSAAEKGMPYACLCMAVSWPWKADEFTRRSAEISLQIPDLPDKWKEKLSEKLEA